MTQTSSQRVTHSAARSEKQLLSFRRGRVNTRKEAQEQLKLQRNLQRRLQKRLTSLFNKFVRTQLFLWRGTSVYDEDAAAAALQEELMPTLLAHYRRLFNVVYKNNEAKYQALFKDVGSVFGRNKELEEFVNLWFGTRAPQLRNISEDLARRIGASIKAGRNADLNLDQIARKVQRDFGISRSRAALIARTETHNALGFANHKYHSQMAEEFGIETMKKWVATSDDRTRSFHADANGQLVSLEDDFEVGGARMSYAGDPRGGAKNVINCRCVVVYVDPEDVVDGETPQPTDAAEAVADTEPDLQGFRLGREPNSRDSIQNMIDRARNAGKLGAPRRAVMTKIREAGDLRKTSGLMDELDFRFKGRGPKDVGGMKITKAQLELAGYDEFETEMFFQVLDEAIADCNAIAQKFGCSPIMGVKSLRKKDAGADMGDGILGINIKAFLRYFRDKDGTKVDWENGGDMSGKLGDRTGWDFDRKQYAKDYAEFMATNPNQAAIRAWRKKEEAKMPMLADYYLDDGLNRMRATIFHEFGHTLHQTFGVSTKSRDLFTRQAITRRFAYEEGQRAYINGKTMVEEMLEGIVPRIEMHFMPENLGPSRYGMSDPEEWFAENFSVWVMGRDDLCAPSFLELMQELMDEAPFMLEDSFWS